MAHGMAHGIVHGVTECDMRGKVALDPEQRPTKGGEYPNTRKDLVDLTMSTLQWVLGYWDIIHF